MPNCQIQAVGQRKQWDRMSGSESKNKRPQHGNFGQNVYRKYVRVVVFGPQKNNNNSTAIDGGIDDGIFAETTNISDSGGRKPTTVRQSFMPKGQKHDHSTAMSGKLLTEKMTKVQSKVQFQVGLSLQR